MSQHRRLPGTRRWAVAAIAACTVLVGGETAYAHVPCNAMDSALIINPGSPVITLTPGEKYFRDNGTPSLLLGTNPVSKGRDITQFQTLFAQAAANERIVRIHISNGTRPDHHWPGDIDCDWLYFWDDVFYWAEYHGLQVLPVLDVWADWDGNPARAALTQSWTTNIYNAAGSKCGVAGYTCGTATDPKDLLISGSSTQTTWLTWIGALVQRWDVRPNIMGWEVFSEVNKIESASTGLTSETDGVTFVQKAVGEVRRWSTKPVTASLSGVYVWTTLDDDTDPADTTIGSPDFVQLHPYAGFQAGNLDSWILTNVRSALTLYAKPVFIGESGLSTDLPTLGSSSITMDPDAPTGIRQAIWAGAVSGSMSARLLWFEDGYDVFQCATPGANPCTTPIDLRTSYANASAPVKAFLTGVDYTGFGPITLTYDALVLDGATLGHTDRVIGWVRDVASVAPDWPQNLVSGQSVTVELTGVWDDWLVDFYDTVTGALIPNESLYVQQDGNGDITFTLPAFNGSVAFRITGMAALAVEIDIRPFNGANANSINPSTAGTIPVAILTTSVADGDVRDFVATLATVDITSVEFGPGLAPVRASMDLNVDGDSDVDLLLTFRKRRTGITCTEDQDNGGVVTLTGRTTEGRSFVGEDYVEVLGLGCP